jgi:hypothetical protein
MTFRTKNQIIPTQYPGLCNDPYSFVFIVDSQSPDDLYGGYTIGMALRDALNAIRIPTVYTLAINISNFTKTFKERLPQTIQHYRHIQTNRQIFPFIHLSMHGDNNGIVLTNGDFLTWSNLKEILLTPYPVMGHEPYLCMASCNGINAVKMANIFSTGFTILIGNVGIVLQADITVAYLAFYNSLFNKKSTFEDAVNAMRMATGDNNYKLIKGEDIKKQKLAECCWPGGRPIVSTAGIDESILSGF